MLSWRPNQSEIGRVPVRCYSVGVDRTCCFGLNRGFNAAEDETNRVDDLWSDVFDESATLS